MDDENVTPSSSSSMTTGPPTQVIPHQSLLQRAYIDNTINIACASRIFPSTSVIDWTYMLWPTVHMAEGYDCCMVEEWQTLLDEEVHRRNNFEDESLIGPPPPGSVETIHFNVPPSVVPMEEMVAMEESILDSDLQDAIGEDSLQELSFAELNAEQRFTFSILRWHLDETILGHNPDPLRLIMSGSGGTGKSRVIQSITQLFEAR